MTDNEIGIAVSEVVGWQDVVAFGKEAIGLPPGFTEDQCPEGADELIPDYTNDLNAMAEAKRILLTTWELQDRFLMNLYNVFAEHPDGFRDSAQVLALKTAKDEAVALLRTIGKWKEDAK